MQAIPVQLAVEDELSEAVLRRLLAETRLPWHVGTCYMNHGFGYLKSSIAGFNNACKCTPFIVLTDLDREECAPTLMASWLKHPRHPNLLFRVAVREVEAWLLADADHLAAFLRVDVRHLPADPEALTDPKATLVNLALKSSSREVREDVAPAAGTTAVQGPNYNGFVGRFISHEWRPAAAARKADSLRRALRRLRNFKPLWA